MALAEIPSAGHEARSAVLGMKDVCSGLDSRAIGLRPLSVSLMQDAPIHSIHFLTSYRRPCNLAASNSTMAAPTSAKQYFVT